MGVDFHGVDGSAAQYKHPQQPAKATRVYLSGTAGPAQPQLSFNGASMVSPTAWRWDRRCQVGCGWGEGQRPGSMVRSVQDGRCYN